ncbi:MAG: hypothetical protein IPM83_16265 [Ignavibacteria bacterium]|nr:hypothetical protein [Ignavibacteria bacterium]
MHREFDGKYLAFGKTEGGSDWNDIWHHRSVHKQILPEVVKWTKNSGVSWHEGGLLLPFAISGVRWKGEVAHKEELLSIGDVPTSLEPHG